MLEEYVGVDDVAGLPEPVRGVHREDCLAVRASDTRLCDYEGVVHPDYLVAKYGRGRRPRVVGVESERVVHPVVLSGEVIRELCRPVWIEYPGVRLTEAAGLLGRHAEALRRWLPMRPGRDTVTRAAVAAELPFGEFRWHAEMASRDGMRSAGVREAGTGGEMGSVLHVRYEPAGCHRQDRRGVEVPVVWSEWPLDPGAALGRVSLERVAEYSAWSAALPSGYEVELERLPRWRGYGDGVRFRGWEWACPGRWVLDGDGEKVLRRCDRRVKTLYAPLPRLAGAWPGVRHGLRKERSGLAGLRGLACETCWGLRRDKR